MLKKLSIVVDCSTQLLRGRAFLSQVLDSDKTCHHAVSRVIATLAAEKAEVSSANSSAYCQARQRLPEKLLQRLFGQVAQKLEQQVSSEQLWCGESSAVGGFPAVGDWRTRRVGR